MDAITLDQFLVFVAVVDAGSFSAAARRLNKAQSAVTYAVQKLEEQVGSPLFDRSAYRPGLTGTGRILLPQARRILDDVGRFRASARQVSRGLEAELRLLVAGGAPVSLLSPALLAFRDEFPTVRLRITVQPFSLGVGRDAPGTAPGEADIRILFDNALPDTLERQLVAVVRILSVAAPSHPLASLAGPLGDDVLRDHMQIVLSEVREAVPGDERRVAALNTWRVTDPATQHALILAGVGWGSLPDAAVADDLASGRLVQLRSAVDGRPRRPPEIPLVAVHRRDEPPGPAGRWLLDRWGGGEGQR